MWFIELLRAYQFPVQSSKAFLGTLCLYQSLIDQASHARYASCMWLSHSLIIDCFTFDHTVCNILARKMPHRNIPWWLAYLQAHTSPTSQGLHLRNSVYLHRQRQDSLRPGSCVATHTCKHSQSDASEPHSKGITLRVPLHVVI